MPGLDPVGFFPLFSPALPSATTPWSWGCLEITKGIFSCYFCHLEEPGGAELHLANITANTFTSMTGSCHLEQPEAHLQCIVWFIALFFYIHTPSKGSINAGRITGIESLLLKGNIHWEINILEVSCIRGCICWGSDIQSRLLLRTS